jgi:hypothetical protein
MGDESQASLTQHRRELHGIHDDRTRMIGLTASRAREQQKQHLDSVSSRIAGAILDFMRLHDGLNFFADDLRKHVTAKCGIIAPDSAGRVMRDLRDRGLIEYQVKNRSQSLYHAGSVE